VSLYVPDDLKTRMGAVGEAANWSEIVRPAILPAVTSHEFRAMTTIVESVERKASGRYEEVRALAGRRLASDKAR
jgi:hypothetical protein